MKLFFSILLFTILLGCGSSKDSNKKATLLKETSINKSLITTEKKPIKYKRELTFYIHGYDKDGEKSHRVFGDDEYDPILDKIRQFGEFKTTQNYPKHGDTNIVALTSYYGDTPPAYYTNKDIKDIQNAPKGIPRYSLIVAKSIKHLLKETNTSKINIISVSMGSLVARYMIEKDLEHLSSNKLFKSWISLEGVIAGNIATSQDRLLNIVNSIEKQPTEVKQMKYSWIKREFGSTHHSNSPYLKDIKIAFESSTDDRLNQRAITLLTGKPNDGVVSVDDSYFSDNPYIYPHAYFHQTHFSLTDKKEAWGYVATFLSSNRRVKIRLKDATIYNLHENKTFVKDFKPAEIVFASKVYSPKAMDKWGIDGAIDERVLDSHILKIFKYYKEDENRSTDLNIFDSYVLNDEDSLEIEITPYELDYEPFYNLYEITGHKDHQKLDTFKTTIPLKNGIYDISLGEWSGELEIKVE